MAKTAKKKQNPYIEVLLIMAIVIGIMLIVFLTYRIFTTLPTSNKTTVPPVRYGNYSAAVINDTTNEIVWAGAPQLCIPAANGTHLVYGCMAVNNHTYNCEGIYYNLSNHMISC